MVSRAYITEWSSVAPWISDEQIEQHLIISRALCEIFKNDFLADRLAFRGGTALHKLYIKPAIRYSEDIDLVQIRSEPIKPTIIALRESLSFLGNPSIHQKKDNNTLIFRIAAESPDPIVIRLKTEINCREHFSVLGYIKHHFEVNNSWYSSHCNILSYELEELLGTKLRALYQRRKGRDLFDLYMAINHTECIDIDKILHCFKKYFKFSNGIYPTKKQFTLNMEKKLKQSEFLGDTTGLLKVNAVYDPSMAWNFIQDNLIERL